MKSSRHFRRGFTLIELMTSMTILTIILLITGRIITTAQSSVRAAENSITVDLTHRQVVQVMRRDFAQMISLQPARPVWEKLPGNDSFSLWVHRKGYAGDENSADRDLSLVKYLLDDEGACYRACLGYSYEALPPWQDRQILPKIPDENRQMLSETMLRMEIEFLLQKNNELERHAKPLNPDQSPTALVITMAYLPTKQGKKLSATQRLQIAEIFDDASENKEIRETWSEALTRATRSPLNGIPASVYADVRVKQHTFLLPSHEN